jgi:hypothetical protein
MHTGFAVVLVAGTLLAILTLGAFAVVRIRALAFWGAGMSCLLLVVPFSVMRWPGELVPTLLMGIGIVAAGWGFARAVTVDYVAMRKLPGFAFRRGARQPGRREVLACGLGFLLVGAAYLYFSARPMAGWVFLLFGVQFATALLYPGRGAETPA